MRLVYYYRSNLLLCLSLLSFLACKDPGAVIPDAFAAFVSPEKHVAQNGTMSSSKSQLNEKKPFSTSPALSWPNGETEKNLSAHGATTGLNDAKPRPCRTPSPPPIIQYRNPIYRIIQDFTYALLGIELVPPIDPDRSLIDRRIALKSNEEPFDFRRLDEWKQLSPFQLDQLTAENIRLVQSSVFKKMDPNILACIDSPVLDAMSLEQCLEIPFETLQLLPIHIYKHLKLNARSARSDAHYAIAGLLANFPIFSRLKDYFKRGYQIEVGILTILMNGYKIIVNGLLLELPIALFKSIKTILYGLWIYIATSRLYIWLIGDLITLEKIIDWARYYAKRFRYAITNVIRNIKRVVTSIFSAFQAQLTKWIWWVLPSLRS